MKASDEVMAADAAIDAMWRRSWIGMQLASFVCRLHAAWDDSTCRRMLRRAGLCS